MIVTIIIKDWRGTPVNWLRWKDCRMDNVTVLWNKYLKHNLIISDLLETGFLSGLVPRGWEDVALKGLLETQFGYWELLKPF